MPKSAWHLLFYAAGADVFQLSRWSIDEGKGIDYYLASSAGLIQTSSARRSPSWLMVLFPFSTRSTSTISLP